MDEIIKTVDSTSTKLEKFLIEHQKSKNEKINVNDVFTCVYECIIQR